MVDGNAPDGSRLSQSQIDGDSTAALFIESLAPPERNAATCGAKVELQCVASRERLGRARDLDSFVLVVIRPQNAVSPARGAVASGGAIGYACKCPARATTEARSFEHGLVHGTWVLRPDAPAHRKNCCSAAKRNGGKFFRWSALLELSL